MLEQLHDLVQTTEGRYATHDELNFIQDYLKEAEHRIQIYETIRNAEENLLDDIFKIAKQKKADAFIQGDKGHFRVAKRDVRHHLRHLAATLLITDVTQLRDNLLIWYRTIVMAHRVQHDARVAYKAQAEVLQQLLPEPGYAKIKSALEMSQSFLAKH